MNKWILVVALLGVVWSWQRNRPQTADHPPAERIEGVELVQTIVDDGSNVDLQAYLLPDTWTLFEYTADW